VRPAFTRATDEEPPTKNRRLRSAGLEVWCARRPRSRWTTIRLDRVGAAPHTDRQGISSGESDAAKRARWVEKRRRNILSGDPQRGENGLRPRSVRVDPGASDPEIGAALRLALAGGSLGAGPGSTSSNAPVYPALDLVPLALRRLEACKSHGPINQGLGGLRTATRARARSERSSPGAGTLR
jgi:hypothetical protein